VEEDLGETKIGGTMMVVLQSNIGESWNIYMD